MKATPELAEAVSRLRTSNDFSIVMKYISDYGEELVEQMIYAQDQNQLRAIQGRTQAVTEILKTVQTASDKFRN